jgi:hypothetical protein
VHQFDLTDAAGTPHRYEVMPHTPTDGWEVTSLILAAIIDPVAETALPALLQLLPDVIRAGAIQDKEKGGRRFELAALLDNDMLLERLGALRFDGAGPAIKRAVRALDMPTIRRILRHTTLDGKALSKDLNFDTAYAANYTEMMQAVWEVCRHNAFFGPLGGFVNLAGSLTTGGLGA